jgi:hypothetical protein
MVAAPLSVPHLDRSVIPLVKSEEGFALQGLLVLQKKLEVATD